ncbi:hypothetical protein EYB25_002479 [Talaromyces marneffei]|nr:hypothetical protein EYB25_002479 [Talaromyces marneffei]
MATSDRRSHDEYTVGWICVLPLEMAAAKVMLDEIHEDLPVSSTDHNTYILGRIKEHNIAIACLPSGNYGLVSANSVAMQLLSSFPSIRFGLMVGIGGGVPNDAADIRLGDVVISKPTDTCGGVMQYDYGKALNGGKFQQTGMLNRPPQILLTALSKMQANHLMAESKIADFIAEIRQKIPGYASQFARPRQADRLYHADYDHVDINSTACNACDAAQIVSRRARGHDKPLIHYGVIASANQLVRDSQLRNRLSRELGVYCVEMEAAGLMNNYPCLVIRGICDYADSHKNKEWQGYASAVAAAYAKELLLCIPIMDIDRTRSLEDAVSVRFNLPFNLTGLPAIENFLGRQKELERLWHHLQPQNSNSRTVAILQGLGGIGKTQLALRFARDHKADYTTILWVNGRSRGTLLQSLSAILPRLASHSQTFAVTDKEEVEQYARQVLKWLALPGNSRWLLIFDNVDEYSPETDDGYDIQKYFPTADHGSILITSRLQSLTEVGRSFAVPTLDNNEAILLLWQSRNLRTPEIITENEVDQDTNDLIDRLGGLPLAITIAGAFMRETGTSIREYLQYYQKSWHALQLRARPTRHYQQGNLLQTWLISYNEIQKRDAHVAELMLLLAHFNNRDIWYELVKGNIRTLIQFSLIEVNQQSDSYSIHPVVQDWCLNMAQIDGHELNSHWYELALIAISSTVPSSDTRDYWRLQQRLLVHADFVRQALKSDLLTDNVGVWDALHILGNLYFDQGKLQDAEMMYQRALVGKEKALGPGHISTFSTVNNLGLLYSDQGKFKEAEMMYQQAFAGYEKALGPDHTSTLSTVNNLGNLYFDQGKLQDAEMMYQRALVGKEKALGPGHVSTLDTMSNLGTLYFNQGKLKKAEIIFQRALAGYKKALGADHTSTFSAVNNLGLLYSNEGKLKEAELMYQQAFTGYEKALGPNHRATLDTVNNLGILYISQGKFKEAEMMYQRALAGYRKALGPDHISTFSTVNNLGLLYSDQGKFKEAEMMYQQAFIGYKKALGPDHTSTLTTVYNLGNLYFDQGKFEDAEMMYQQALIGREKVLGLDHTLTLDTINNLGLIYSYQDKFKEAEIIYQRALAIREKTLGPDHTSTLKTVYSLGNLYADQRKLKEAEMMYQRALAGYQKAHGPDHYWTKEIAEALRTLSTERGHPIRRPFHRK